MELALLSVVNHEIETCDRWSREFVLGINF